MMTSPPSPRQQSPITDVITRPTIHDSFNGPNAVFTILLTVASLVGAILMLVLMTSPKYRTRSYSVYFMFLAVTDFLCVLLDGLADIDDWVVDLRGDDTFFYRHVEGCFLLGSVTTIFKLCSSWFLVAVTVDRFVSVFFPHMRTTICTRSRAFTACMVIALVCTGFAMVSVLANIDNIRDMYADTSNGCLYDATHFVRGYDVFLYLFLTLVIPIPIVITLAVKLLRKYRREGTTELMTSLNMEDHIKHSAYSLAVIGVCSAVMLTPLLLAEFAELIMANSRADFDGFSGGEHVTWSVCHLFSMVNYSCKFYLLIVCGRMYREDIAVKFGFGPFPQKLRNESVDGEGEMDGDNYA